MRQAQHTANTPLNMFITTICTRKSMNSQDKQEGKRQQVTDNSCQLASFHLKIDNERKSLHDKNQKICYYLNLFKLKLVLWGFGVLGFWGFIAVCKYGDLMSQQELLL